LPKRTQRHRNPSDCTKTAARNKKIAESQYGDRLRCPKRECLRKWQSLRTRVDSRLLEQVRRMESLANNCSAVIDYSSTGYTAVAGTDVIVAGANRRALPSQSLTSLGDFLADRFLGCQVGYRGLYYDAHCRLLTLPPRLGHTDVVAFFVSDRLRIEIEETAR